MSAEVEAYNKGAGGGQVSVSNCCSLESERDALLAAQKDSAMATLTPAAALLCGINIPV
ncbi:hypothetical protein J2W42_005569 [Rhizobium tibeticum]|uniref:hypothetical protein n=1 Tax=Rhizobium tibeticum TaxID=501024 RepID=UPI0027858056|nr:hypothetical protein [Rhizobium tibeticum]MDP9812699.1 hypothetical protein [Rhizobium tibeticum]